MLVNPIQKVCEAYYYNVMLSKLFLPAIVPRVRPRASSSFSRQCLRAQSTFLPIALPGVD